MIVVHYLLMIHLTSDEMATSKTFQLHGVEGKEERGARCGAVEEISHSLACHMS